MNSLLRSCCFDHFISTSCRYPDPDGIYRNNNGKRVKCLCKNYYVNEDPVFCDDCILNKRHLSLQGYRLDQNCQYILKEIWYDRYDIRVTCPCGKFVKEDFVFCNDCISDGMDRSLKGHYLDRNGLYYIKGFWFDRYDKLHFSRKGYRLDKNKQYFLDGAWYNKYDKRVKRSCGEYVNESKV